MCITHYIAPDYEAAIADCYGRLSSYAVMLIVMAKPNKKEMIVTRVGICYSIDGSATEQKSRLSYSSSDDCHFFCVKKVMNLCGRRPACDFLV